MAELDLSTLSVSELSALINEAQSQRFVAEAAAQQEAEARRMRLRDAVGQLTDLLGAVDSDQSMESIRGVLAYGEEAIAANPGQAVVLILRGMERLAMIQLDLAQTISE